MASHLHPLTLRTAVTVQGRGLHSGHPCRVTIHPVRQAAGLTFLHTPSGVEIPVRSDLTGDLRLATTLVKQGVRLQTVEHLLAALGGLDIWHARIEVSGEELPILDGSAEPWIRALDSAGTRALPGPRRWIRILRPLEVREGGRWIRVSPHDGLRVRYTIDFDHPAIGRQSRELTLTPDKFRREVARARTFCLEQEVAKMQAMGLAQGGSLENAVVFGPEGPLNEVLRFEDEAVRHKILDLVGDLALIGAPLHGFVEVHAGGHALHVALAKALAADPSAWRWEDASAPAAPRFRRTLAAQPLHA